MIRIKLTLVAILAGFLLQSCAPNHTEFSGENAQSLLDVAADPYVANTKSCQFIDKDTISYILKNHLGIPSGDVAMTDESGRALRSSNCRSYSDVRGDRRDCNYLEVFANDLSDTTCSATKFKIVSEIFINACAAGLADGSVRDTLFPQGYQNIEQLYFAFTGKLPTADEKEIVRSAVSDSSLSDEEKEAMTCAVVASSLASVTIL